jgi:hypothetical protein
MARVTRAQTRAEAAMDGLGNAPDGLHPAEGLLDLFSPLLRQGVARVPGGSAADGGAARLLRGVRMTRALRGSATKPALS